MSAVFLDSIQLFFIPMLKPFARSISSLLLFLVISMKLGSTLKSSRGIKAVYENIQQKTLPFTDNLVDGHYKVAKDMTASAFDPFVESP